MAGKNDYDLLVIGLGPAGMAVSAMGSAMGLDVAAVERHKIGGECLNYGCIPSKALLKTAKVYGMFNCLEDFGLCKMESPPELKNPLERMRGVVKFVNEEKTGPMFDKVDLYLEQGDACFVDARTIKIGDKKLTAKHIFIATGTSSAIPPIPGLADVPYLTNSNIWSIEKPPESMTIIGGGAIGTEMAQTFSRFGSEINIVHMDPHLVPAGDAEAAALIYEKLVSEGVTVHNSARITGVEKQGDDIVLWTEDGAGYRSKSLLVAAGRKVELESLQLDNADIRYGKNGIIVDKHLRTSQKNVYAIGDCNGHYLLTHAAMHQGMTALMNAMLPGLCKIDFRKYIVPWTVFTDPEISQVGMTEKELKAKGIKYEVIRTDYEDYGRTVADGNTEGFIKALVSKTGRIYGVTIAGEGAGEMIHEFAFAIQEKKRLHNIMFLQHSFPTFSFMNKRIAETWMMERMKSPWLRRLVKAMV